MAQRITQDKIDRFLAVLADTGNVSAAARAAGMPRQIAYALKRDDKDFALLWDDALETATDALAQEARRRALQGVDAPHFHKGEVTGTVTKYSDALLMFLLKAHRPEIYRDGAKPKEASATTVLTQELSDAKDRLRERLHRLQGRPAKSGTSGGDQ
ncbi:MAG: terminase [Alphaproteobacteria bacterium]|nr:terminase [Alphaproteobacteria bacterium]